jgi:hypothetical protein
MTIRDVALLFGVCREVVSLWVERDWFPPLVRGPRNAVVFDRVDLVHFIRNRESWVAWEPTQIGDEELRRVARYERSAAFGRWYDYVALADLCGATVDQLKKMAAREKVFAGYPRQEYRRAFIWLTNNQADRIAAARKLPTRHLMAVIVEER